MITPYIKRHEVQLLINRINNKISSFFWEFLLSEKVSSAIMTVENIRKKAINAHVIDVQITWESNYRYPIKKKLSLDTHVIVGWLRDK